MRVQSSGESLQIEFASTVDDQIAQQRYRRCRLERGRYAWYKTWFPAAIVITAVVMLKFWFDAPRNNLRAEDLWGIAGVALVLFAVIAIVGIKMSSLPDRKTVSRELDAAHALSKTGACPDPFGRVNVTFSPGGYTVDTSDDVYQRNWSDVARVEMFEGYLVTVRSSTKLGEAAVELAIPPRAMGSDVEAQRAMQLIETWHAKASRPA